MIAFASIPDDRSPLPARINDERGTLRTMLGLSHYPGPLTPADLCLIGYLACAALYQLAPTGTLADAMTLTWGRMFAERSAALLLAWPERKVNRFIKLGLVVDAGVALALLWTFPAICKKQFAM